MKTLEKIEISEGILVSTPEVRKDTNGLPYAVFKAEIEGSVFEIKTSGKVLHYLKGLNLGDEIIIHWKTNKYQEIFATFVRNKKDMLF
ncbi:hypothetical protein [Persephonella sp.]